MHVISKTFYSELDSKNCAKLYSYAKGIGLLKQQYLLPIVVDNLKKQKYAVMLLSERILCIIQCTTPRVTVFYLYNYYPKPIQLSGKHSIQVQSMQQSID